MNESHELGSDAAWQQVAPHLDTALGELNEGDRDALWLRYFQRKPAREMAILLRTSEEAAQKRVSRAVERLRDAFAKRGVTIGPGGLSVVMSANVIQSAPVGLATTIAATALAGTTAATTATGTAAQAIAMTATQKALITATLAAAVGAGLFQTRQASVLRARVRDLQERRSPLAEQIDQLGRERDDARRQLALARNQNVRANQDSAELLKLRNDVARLQRESKEAARAAEQRQDELRRTLMSIPPVKTFVVTAQTTASWDQGVLTGGWKTPSGKRALVLMTFEPGGDGRQITIHSRIMEFTEEAGESIGLAQYNIDAEKAQGPRPAKVHKLAPEQTQAILKAARDTQGIDVLEAPRVTTLSGNQAQIQAVQTRSMPTGEPFSTGPVLDFIPTVSPDGQSVQVIFSAQLNFLVPQPHIKWE